jgi:GTP cyclohydrolase I
MKPKKRIARGKTQDSSSGATVHHKTDGGSYGGSNNSPRPAAAAGSIAPHIREILRAVGEDPDRAGLLHTPDRVELAYRFFTSGYSKTVRDVVGKGVFEQETDEMVIVKDIELYSLCEHHLVPFFGKAHVAYLPGSRMTTQIAHAIEEALEPRGVGVVIEAAHLCMMMRGVEKQNSVTVTSCMLGRFRTDEKTRSEFLTLALRPKP